MRDLKIIPRVDVGQCPICGSKLTCRLKKGKWDKPRFHFGNPVYYTANPGEYTCICPQCGIRWRGDFKFTLITFSELRSLFKDWMDFKFEFQSESLTYKEQQEIMRELCNDMYLPYGKNKKRKKKQSGFVMTHVKRATKDTFLGPFYAVKNVAENLFGKKEDFDTTGYEEDAKHIKRRESDEDNLQDENDEDNG